MRGGGRARGRKDPAAHRVPLDTRRGVIQAPPNLPLWDEVPICALLSERYGCPAYLQNDANACAIAEWRFGAGRGTRNMVFLTFGTGLGAGLILDGRLYEGANGMAGEAGHLRLAADGPEGYGKRGSFEGFCSGGVLIDLFNPERIVIGSIFARAEALFRPGMEAVIAREALAQSAAVCRVVPAQLGDSIGDVAALTIAIEFSQKNGKSVTDYGA